MDNSALRNTGPDRLFPYLTRKATYGRRFDLADARFLSYWPYLGDIGERVVELVISGLEYRRLWRHRKLKVGLGTITSHVLDTTMIAAFVVLRSHDKNDRHAPPSPPTLTEPFGSFLLAAAGCLLLITYATHFKLEQGLRGAQAPPPPQHRYYYMTRGDRVTM